jgi:hypothetical protein
MMPVAFNTPLRVWQSVCGGFTLPGRCQHVMSDVSLRPSAVHSCAACCRHASRYPAPNFASQASERPCGGRQHDRQMQWESISSSVYLVAVCSVPDSEKCWLLCTHPCVSLSVQDMQPTELREVLVCSHNKGEDLELSCAARWRLSGACVTMEVDASLSELSWEATSTRCVGEAQQLRESLLGCIRHWPARVWYVECTDGQKCHL